MFYYEQTLCGRNITRLMTTEVDVWIFNLFLIANIWINIYWLFLVIAFWVLNCFAFLSYISLVHMLILQMVDLIVIDWFHMRNWAVVCVGWHDMWNHSAGCGWPKSNWLRIADDVHIAFQNDAERSGRGHSILCLHITWNMFLELIKLWCEFLQIE